MNSISRILLLIAILAFSGHTYAQSSNEGSSSKVLNFQDRDTQLNVLSNQNNELSTSASLVDQNNIFISQIGNDNTINSSINSASTDVNLGQFGNGNNLFLNLQANQINERIVQNGDNNTITDTNYFRINEHNVEVIQNGNRQNLTLFGENSISKNLKVTTHFIIQAIN